MAALFKLRISEPGLERSFMAPGYPVVPAIALFLSIGCLVTMVWFNQLLFVIFVGMMVIAFVLWKLFGKRSISAVIETAE
jgi:ethanolamine permease